MWTPDYDIFKQARRRIMRALQDQSLDHETFYTLHIDSIKPTDEAIFYSKGTINRAGYAEYWQYLYDEIHVFDREGHARVKINQKRVK